MIRISLEHSIDELKQFILFSTSQHSFDDAVEDSNGVVDCPSFQIKRGDGKIVKLV